MIKDVMSIPAIGQGILHNLKKIVKRLDLDITIAVDQEFETLYPIEDIKDWKVAQERETQAVAELANNWAAESPANIVRKIALYESEARSANYASTMDAIFSSSSFPEDSRTYPLGQGYYGDETGSVIDRALSKSCSRKQ